MKADIKPHFAGKEPVVTSIYERLMAELRKIGPVKVESKKTCIHLVSKWAFAGVYTRRNYVNLEVSLDYKIQSARVQRVDQVSANRYHHKFTIQSEAEIDRQMMGWLKDAYQLKA